MRKIFKFITKYWLIIFLILTILLFIINKLLTINQPTPITPVPESTSVANYQSILPGSTTFDNVNELLGFPLEINGGGEKTIAEYRSSNQYRNHTIVFENSVAVFIKEEVISSNEKTVNSIIKVYGIAPYTLYDQRPSSVFNLYVYPNNGIAYLGGDDGTILEVWYFKPTTIDDFVNRWGSDFAKEKSKVIPKY